MAPQKLALFAVRPRCTWQIAVLSFAVLTVGGCSHSRNSYRPIFATPVPVTKPCTNCGGSSATVIEEPTGGTVSSVPSLVDTPISDTPAASSTAPSGAGSGTVRSSTVEKPPKARLDDEPGLNETLSPAPSSGVGGGTTPPAAQTPWLRLRIGPHAARADLVGLTRGVGRRFPGCRANQRNTPVPCPPHQLDRAIEAFCR